MEIAPRLTPHRAALRLAATYVVVGGIWIVFSDRVLGDLGLPRSLTFVVGTAKGLLFVVVTGTLLYALSRTGLTRVQEAQAALRAQEMRIREAYVDVLDAVTGGKLVLVTEDEMFSAYGVAVVGETPVLSGAELAGIRRRIRGAAEGVVSPEGVSGVISASGEALNNVLKHAGTGAYAVRVRDGVLQVQVSDDGPGIDFRTLPKATLTPGFSTAATLGMGFTIMLQLSDRMLICTEPGSTTVLLEFSRQPRA